ncbi:MAG: DUF1573 domain-containing protein [Muribaculaceae bacterium]
MPIKKVLKYNKCFCLIKNCLPIVMVLLDMLISVGVSPAKAQSEIEWVKGREHNFGAVLESDSMVNHRFVMRNGGNEPFSIVGATPRCRCTEAKFTPKVLAPGDTTSVLVTFYPRNRSGTFVQRVAVTTTSRSRISYLFVRGNVVPGANDAEVPQSETVNHKKL